MNLTAPRHRVHRGRTGETLAIAFLTLSGYDVVRRNVRFGSAEIDLIARRGRVVAFVEVKLRRTLLSAAEAIRWDQRQRILRATHDASRALSDRNLTPRYDVVAIGLDRDRGQVVARHYRNVFAPPSTFR